MTKTTIFITYESPWFLAGGIAAVMGQLPGTVHSASKCPTMVITPFHVNSRKIANLKMDTIGTLKVELDNKDIVFEICHYMASVSWFFVKITDAIQISPPFFNGQRHPYDVPKDDLVRDSLLFGAVTVRSLPIIANHIKLDCKSIEWNLFAQDWEAATALLAFQSQNTVKGRLHLTLHNSYDEGIKDEHLIQFGINPKKCKGNTILDRALRIIEQPVFTVSEQFALDFTQEILQREIMAPQLQDLLNSNPIVGVDNGPFKSVEVDASHIYYATIGNFGSFQAWKRKKTRIREKIRGQVSTIDMVSFS